MFVFPQLDDPTIRARIEFGNNGSCVNSIDISNFILSALFYESHFCCFGFMLLLFYEGSPIST